MSRSAKIATVAVGIAALVGLFVLLNGSSDNDNSSNSTTVTTEDSATGTTTQRAKPKKPEVPTIEVKDGKPVSGVRKLDFKKDDKIRFKVTSDVSDDVHVHGYDISKPVGPGRSASFNFPADIEGIFEGELEQRGEPIVELQVNP